MKNKLIKTIAATSAALALPVVALLAQSAGAGTSGFTAGPGNTAASDARGNPNPGAVTSGTAAPPVITGNADTSGHTGTARNGQAETTGSAVSTPIPVIPH